jgi:hypothetical protein
MSIELLRISEKLLGEENLECSPYGHQLIIMTILHSVVRGNVGATLVVARKTSSGGDKPLPYINFPRTKCYVHKICQIKKLITIR